MLFACNDEKKNNAASAGTPETPAPAAGGQEAVQDDVSAKDIVKVAVGSKDHTTLVAALKQADLVTSLSNAGPLSQYLHP